MTRIVLDHAWAHHRADKPSFRVHAGAVPTPAQRHTESVAMAHDSRNSEMKPPLPANQRSTRLPRGESSTRTSTISGLGRLIAAAEHLSGVSLEDVRVHYNSPLPASLQAKAYTQGTEIYLGTGQERTLPHELWHTVQQKENRVRPSIPHGNVNIEPVLEREADIMGRRIVAHGESLVREGFTHETHSARNVKHAEHSRMTASAPGVIQGWRIGATFALRTYSKGGRPARPWSASTHRSSFARGRASASTPFDWWVKLRGGQPAKGPSTQEEFDEVKRSELWNTNKPDALASGEHGHEAVLKGDALTPTAGLPKRGSSKPAAFETWKESPQMHHDDIQRWQLEGVRSQPGDLWLIPGVHWTDAVAPNVAFETGIPLKGHEWDAREHLLGNDNSAWRGTSSVGAGYELVRMMHPGKTLYGYKINHVLGKKVLDVPHPYGYEAEASIASQVPNYCIVEVYIARAGDSLFDRLPNPNYDEKRIQEEQRELGLLRP